MGCRWDLIDDNHPFVDGVPMPKGRDLYPHDVTREEIDKYTTANPGKKAAIYDPYTVVKRQGADLIAVPFQVDTKNGSGQCRQNCVKLRR